jgi:hypothetical protein
MTGWSAVSRRGGAGHRLLRRRLPPCRRAESVGKLGDEGASGPVVVTVMDRERMADYQRMVSDLRNATSPPSSISAAPA